MAINIICPVCKNTFKMGTSECTCGTNLKRLGRYKVRLQMPNGKWRSKQCDTLDLARKVEGKFRTELVEEDVFDKRRAPSIDSLWKKYLKWAKVNKRSWCDDKTRWEVHIAIHLGSKLMNRIMPNDIEIILSDMRQRTNPKGNPYAPATIKQVLVLVKRVYNWAIQKDLYYGANPANKVDIPKFDNKVTNPLSKEDLKRLLAYIETWKNERAELLIKFALFSGRRRGEILHLKWKDVDLDNGLVTFLGANTKNARTQTIPVNQNSLIVLERCRALKLGDFVFSSSTGAFYSTFENTWKRLKKRLALPYRFHDARHTYASYLASSGKVDIYTLKELLGHRELKMTERYAHLVNGALQKATNVADSIFNQTDTNE